MAADSVRQLLQLGAAFPSPIARRIAFDVYKAVERRRGLSVWTSNYFSFGFVVGIGLAVVPSLLCGPRDVPRRTSCAGVRSSG